MAPPSFNPAGRTRPRTVHPLLRPTPVVRAPLHCCYKSSTRREKAAIPEAPSEGCQGRLSWVSSGEFLLEPSPRRMTFIGIRTGRSTRPVLLGVPSFPIGWGGRRSSSRGRTYLYGEYKQQGIYVIRPGDGDDDGGGDGCEYPRCDPPVSPYESTKKTLSIARRSVSLQFGPYRGGYALYYVKIIKNANRDGTPGLFRIVYTGEDDANRPPKAVLDVDKRVGFGPLTVTFDGTGSADPDGDALTYELDWDFDGEVDSASPIATHTYAAPGLYLATLTVTDGSGNSDTAEVTIEVADNPPVPRIESPPEGTTFAVGDGLTLVGSAFDVEDGELPDSSLEWDVIMHHDDHYHPHLGRSRGVGTVRLDGGYPAPPPSFGSSTTAYLVARLTATDSAGISTTTSRVLMPRTVPLTFVTDPPGLRIVANGEVLTAPVTVTTWEGHEFLIEVPAGPQQETAGGVTTLYAWESWSTGGCRAHYVRAPMSPLPSTPPVILAKFREVTFSGDVDESKAAGLQESPGMDDCDSASSVVQMFSAGERPASAGTAGGGMGQGAKVALVVVSIAIGAAIVVASVHHSRRSRSRRREERGSFDLAPPEAKVTEETDQIEVQTVK